MLYSDFPFEERTIHDGEPAMLEALAAEFTPSLPQ